MPRRGGRAARRSPRAACAAQPWGILAQQTSLRMTANGNKVSWLHYFGPIARGRTGCHNRLELGTVPLAVVSNSRSGQGLGHSTPRGGPTEQGQFVLPADGAGRRKAERVRLGECPLVG